MNRETLLVCLTLCFIGCEESATDPIVTHSLSGYVYQNGIPKPGVKVALDNKIKRTVESTTDGHFKIEGVNEGVHLLTTALTYETGEFVENSSDLTVFSDIDLDVLKLPRPVMLSISEEVTSDAMTLSWTQSDALDFREYRLYRHHSSGELVFSSS